MAATYTFTNFNRVPKPWAGGPILLPDKISVQVGYAEATNISPKLAEAANVAAGLFSAQNVIDAAASQGAEHATETSEESSGPREPSPPPPKISHIPKPKTNLSSAGKPKPQQPVLAGKIPVCALTGKQIRGPFILALGKTYAPDAFFCAETGVSLKDRGFVEVDGKLYCEEVYQQKYAPKCAHCDGPVKSDCITAMNKKWCPGCFICFHCKEPIGTDGFHIEDGNQYCTFHWNELFTTKCYACGFPIEPTDRWIEALGQNWHAECFNCAVCQCNLEGQSFYAKGGRPYCKKHASAGFR